jgi:hypothetical protein
VLKELLTTFVVSASAAGVEVTPHDVTQYLDKQATCLAKNMYYEARSQGLAGQLAVSLVVLKTIGILTQSVRLYIKGLLENHGKLKVRMFQIVKEHIIQYETVANLAGIVMVLAMNQKNQQLMVHCMIWRWI